jgi:uncharacterized surface protein with fasciclin (FAS1) repeats
MGGLAKMLKYYKDLKQVFDYLPSSASSSGKTTSLTPTSDAGTCKPTNMKSAVERLFCEDEAKDVFAVARDNGGGYFVDLLWASGLANEMLRSGEEYILLVPQNKCFKTIPKPIRDKMSDNCYLRKLLSYHIAKKERSSSTSINTASKHLTSMNGGKLILYGEMTSPMYSGSRIEGSTIKTTNGDVVMLDAFMTIPEQNIQSILTTASKYQHFLNALQDTDVVRQMKNVRTFTLFATPDTSLTSEQKYNMVRTVLNSMVKGALFKRVFDEDRRFTFKSLSGNDVVVEKTGDIRTFNGVRIAQADIRATDGILYVTK